MIKKLIPLLALPLLATPAFSQESDLVAVLGENMALEQITNICPGVYPDMAVLDRTEDQVMAYMTSTYGADRAMDVLSSAETEREVKQAAYRTLLDFEKQAGGPEKLCDHIRSGAVQGVTLTPPDQQPESLESGDQAPVPMSDYAPPPMPALTP